MLRVIQAHTSTPLAVASNPRETHPCVAVIVLKGSMHWDVGARQQGNAQPVQTRQAQGITSRGVLEITLETFFPAASRVPTHLRPGPPPVLLVLGAQQTHKTSLLASVQQAHMETT